MRRDILIRKSVVMTLALVTAWASIEMMGAASATANAAHRAAATAAPELTGSIVFIKADNVWIARPDGSSARRLTADGTHATPYRSPSEDDAGHVIALRGDRLVRLDQTGRTLQSFTPPTHGLHVDFASVSADGHKVAYSVETSYTDCSFSPCHTFFEHTLDYTYATRSAVVSGTQPQTDALWASWITNSRVVIGTHGNPAIVRYDDIGGTAADWFHDCDMYDDPCASAPDTINYNTFPAVSRSGDRYASVDMVVTGDDAVATYLTFQQTSGAMAGKPPTTPALACALPGIDTTGPWPGQDDATIQTPSWSPGGRALVAAFKNAKGEWQVWRIDVGTSLSGCEQYGGGPIVSGATQPRWSAAPLRSKTTLTLAASPLAGVRRHTVTLTARVSSSAASGSVQFRDGRRVLRTVRVSNGRAVYRTSSLTTGVHTLGAVYIGSGNYFGSTAKGIRVTVQPAVPPHHWHFHAVAVTRLRSTTLGTRKAVDVAPHAPSRARGVLVELELTHATARTAVSLCPRPRRGNGIPQGCWSLSAHAHHPRTGYAITALGTHRQVRLWNSRGRVHATLTVLGYYAQSG